MGYGSVKTWIEQVFLLPYLVIGGNRETFWKLSPKEIQIDFNAYKKRQELEAQARWEIGAYIKLAINSSIFACVLADKSTPNKLAEFPKMPFREEIRQEYTQEQLEAERLKAYVYFKSLAKQKNVKQK